VVSITTRKDTVTQRTAHRKRFPFDKKRRQKKSVTQELAASN